MKDYIVYVDGNRVGKIKAANMNAAEKKAKSKYPKDKDKIWVEPTEF
jgi:hypothetical protein